jgi:hypothetical protein
MTYSEKASFYKLLFKCAAIMLMGVIVILAIFFTYAFAVTGVY